MTRNHFDANIYTNALRRETVHIGAQHLYSFYDYSSKKLLRKDDTKMRAIGKLEKLLPLAHTHTQNYQDDENF